MKFCYIDESGTGSEPFAVMVGLIVDAYRMHPTKADWNKLLEDLSDLTGREITEFHTRNLYPGNGVWRDLEGEMRADIITLLFDWIFDRQHPLIYVAVDKERFSSGFDDYPQSSDVGSLWCYIARPSYCLIEVCNYFSEFLQIHQDYCNLVTDKDLGGCHTIR